MRKSILAVQSVFAALGFMLWMAPTSLAQFGVEKGILPENIAAAGGGRSDLVGLVRIVIDWVLGFLGIILIAMVIYGGFMYVTAGVNEQGAETGKKVLMYAGIGVIVILLSFVFVNAILGAVAPS
jgi:hypothetical protein